MGNLDFNLSRSPKGIFDGGTMYWSPYIRLHSFGVIVT